MQLILHRITALSMALLLLLTTTSFSIEAHFCGDHLVDIALNDHANGCSMQSLDPDMHKAMKDMGCCQDKQIVSDHDDDLQKTAHEFSFEQLVFITVLTHSYVSLFDIDASPINANWNKESPPLLDRDLFLLHDSFLI